MSNPTLKCKYCDEPSAGNTRPPLCLQHLDMAILIDFLAAREQEVTAITLANLLQECSVRKPDSLSITPADIPALLASMNGEGWQAIEIEWATGAQEVTR